MRRHTIALKAETVKLIHETKPDSIFELPVAIVGNTHYIEFDEDVIAALYDISPDLDVAIQQTIQLNGATFNC